MMVRSIELRGSNSFDQVDLILESTESICDWELGLFGLGLGACAKGALGGKRPKLSAMAIFLRIKVLSEI